MSKPSSRLWTRDELLLAINLYCKTPFGKIHISNPDILLLAEYLNRTPGAVSWKLANFASIDPKLSQKGASNVSKLDLAVWGEFFANWEEMAYKSELAAIQMKKDLFEDKIKKESELNTIFPEGKEKELKTKQRVNQKFFRNMILAAYGSSCCITGLPLPELLIASHIVPWSKDKQNRTNPQNGLCLNPLHDKAFDRGLISIDEDYCVMVSPKIKKSDAEKSEILFQYAGNKIYVPKRFPPEQKFFAYHREHVFLS